MKSSITGRAFSMSSFHVVVIVTVGAVAAMLASMAFFVWSMLEVDSQAREREIRIATRLVSTFSERIAHEQESVTVWDEAVLKLREPAGAERGDWIDVNLGSWMNSYFGHDAAFVIDADNEPIFASIDGERLDPSSYEAVRAVADPIAAALRRMLREGVTDGVSEKVLSIGLSEYGYVSEHPVIISLKPVVSDTGEIEQAGGSEFIHVALRKLDSDFLEILSKEYGFRNLHFSAVEKIGWNEAALPFRRSDGTTIGYFVWSPQRPGFSLLKSVMPTMALLFAGLVAGMIVFAVILRRRLQVNREQEERIRYLASHDALTGLFNRAHFERKLDRTLSNDRAGERPFAVVYLDIDRFKQINDNLGHGAGDMVIQQTANRLCELLPKGSTACRVGGDEFNLLIPFEDIREITRLCGSILASVSQPIDVGVQSVSVGVSIGVACYPLDAASRVELVRKADVALYSAKADGRGRFALFAPHMDQQLRERVARERDLRAAIADPGQFRVLYQPKYQAKSGDIVAVEALVRWNHPTDGELSPDAFIPLAEETGLIKPLGTHVLDEACRAAKRWPDLSVAVNISPVQWRDPQLALDVIGALHRAGLDPHRLELEVTDTAWVENSDVCCRNIAALRRIGVAIVLDDFGVGFSSLGRLHDIEVDHVKIDRRFIDGIGASQGSDSIVKAVIDMARAKGLTITAEGVETDEQRDFLVSVGCDCLQGFLFSRPIDEADMDRLLRVARPWLPARAG